MAPDGVRPAPRPALSALVRRAAAHVVVADLDSPRLSGDDAHHLGAVLRLRAGELVSAQTGEAAGGHAATPGSQPGAEGRRPGGAVDGGLR